jgi:hypothetical protein
MHCITIQKKAYNPKPGHYTRSELVTLRKLWYGHVFNTMDNMISLRVKKLRYQINDHCEEQGLGNKTNEGRYTKDNGEDWIQIKKKCLWEVREEWRRLCYETTHPGENTNG